MKALRKWASLALAFAMVLGSMMAWPSAQMVNAEEDPYEDIRVPENWTEVYDFGPDLAALLDDLIADGPSAFSGRMVSPGLEEYLLSQERYESISEYEEYVIEEISYDLEEEGLRLTYAVPAEIESLGEFSPNEGLTLPDYYAVTILCDAALSDGSSQVYEVELDVYRTEGDDTWYFIQDDYFSRVDQEGSLADGSFSLDEYYYGMSEMAMTTFDTADGYSYRLNYDGTAKLTGAPDNWYVEIPSELDGHAVTVIGDSAFYWDDELEEVIIPEGVTEIEPYAFEDCYSLTYVSLPSTLKTIGRYAFANCEELSDITLPEGLTEIGNDAFWYCESLEIVNIPGSVVRIGDEAFADCSALYDVTFGEGVKSIGAYAFQYDYDLENITLPESLERIGEGAFANSGLASIYIPQNVNAIGSSAFANTYISGFSVHPDNATFAEIDGVLFEKTSKTLLCYPSEKEDTYYEVPNGILTIGADAFADNDWLEEIVIPDTVTKIGPRAFEYCYALSNVTMSQNLTSIGENAFYNCYDLTSIELPASLEEIGDYAFSSTGLTYVWIPSGVKTISDGAFSYCADLTQVSMEEGIETIGPDAFSECSSLTTVSLPASLKTLGRGVFSGNSAMTSVTIPAGVEEIQGPIASYSGIGAIRVSPDSATYAEIDGVLFDKVNKVLVEYPMMKTGETYAVPEGIIGIGDNAFGNNETLTSVTLPSTLKSIGASAFYEASITEITIPGSVEKIGDYAFECCYDLATLTLEEGIASLGAYYTFSNCDALTEVVIPSTVTEIPFDCFYSCDMLESVVIPDGLTTIGGWAFENCQSLRSITIPASVTDIGYGVFYNNSDVTMTVDRDSYAATWASENGVNYRYSDADSWLND